MPHRTRQLEVNPIPHHPAVIVKHAASRESFPGSPVPDRSNLCSAATFTAPEDMDFEVIVEWYDCLPGGMAYELGVGGDITSLPDPAVGTIPDRYLEPVALRYTETIELRWLYE